MCVLLSIAYFEVLLFYHDNIHVKQEELFSFIQTEPFHGWFEKIDSRQMESSSRVVESQVLSALFLPSFLYTYERIFQATKKS